jgi:hypothetical protein
MFKTTYTEAHRRTQSKIISTFGLMTLLPPKIFVHNISLSPAQTLDSSVTVLTRLWAETPTNFGLIPIGRDSSYLHSVLHLGMRLNTCRIPPSPLYLHLMVFN